MEPSRPDAGYTVIELMATIAVFFIASAGFYGVLFAVQRGTERSRSSAAVSGEARLGFNRMIRDTREGMELESATPTKFNVRVDFENDEGGPQTLTFEKSGEDILLNGEVLMRGVDCIRATEGSPCSQDVFRYTSNRLEYDWNGDGITSWQELDESASASHGVVGIGNNDGVLNAELPFVSDVTFAVEVTDGETTERFTGHAQLRNRR